MLGKSVRGRERIRKPCHTDLIHTARVRVLLRIRLCSEPPLPGLQEWYAASQPVDRSLLKGPRLTAMFFFIEAAGLEDTSTLCKNKVQAALSQHRRRRRRISWHMLQISPSYAPRNDVLENPPLLPKMHNVMSQNMTLIVAAQMPPLHEKKTDALTSEGPMRRESNRPKFQALYAASHQLCPSSSVSALCTNQCFRLLVRGLEQVGSCWRVKHNLLHRSSPPASTSLKGSCEAQSERREIRIWNARGLQRCHAHLAQPKPRLP